MVKLTQGQWVAIGVGLGVVVLGGVVTVAVREWYKPDVRYEEGSWYISEESQVTQLTLTNYGHGDAERVLITVDFNEQLRNVESGSPHRPFLVSSDGQRTKTVTGSVDRLVPGETLNIFFETDRVEPARPGEHYVTNIVFDGGTGTTGQPLGIFSPVGGLLAIISFLTGAFLALAVKFTRLYRIAVVQHRKLADTEEKHMTNVKRTVAGILAIVAVLGLGGCYVYPAATVQNINTSFAGKQVDEFFLKHGAPVGKYELADGGAIYTWHSEVSTVHVPGSSHTYINNSGYGVTAHTTHTGGFDVKRYSKLEIVTNPDNKIVEIKLAEDTRGHWKLSRFKELFNEYNPPPVPRDSRMVSRARTER